MGNRLLSTFSTDDSTGYAEVKYNSSTELIYVKFYDEWGRLYYTEEHPNKTVKQVEESVQDWAAGNRELIYV